MKPIEHKKYESITWKASFVEFWCIRNSWMTVLLDLKKSFCNPKEKHSPASFTKYYLTGVTPKNIHMHLNKTFGIITLPKMLLLFFFNNLLINVQK